MYGGVSPRRWSGNYLLTSSIRCGRAGKGGSRIFAGMSISTPDAHVVVYRPGSRRIGSPS